MKALIDKTNNRICQIEKDDDIFPVAVDFLWADCPDNCTTHWKYDGSTFSENDPKFYDNQFIGDAILDNDQLMAIIVDDRNKRLAASDWTQLPDIPATVNKAAWIVYRQALRDLPATIDLANPVFPVPPL